MLPIEMVIGIIKFSGEVAERSIASVLKAEGPTGPGGSNPSLPAEWMGGREAYSTRLESGSPPKTGIVGSNPTSSAESSSGIVGHLGAVGWTGSSAGLESR